MDSTSARRTTREYLNAPGDVYTSDARPAVTRYPLVYTPRSTTQVNFARLPHTEALRGMDLAYREQLLTDGEIAQRLRRGSLALIVGGIVASIVLVYIAPEVSALPTLWIGENLAVLGLVGALILSGVQNRLLRATAIPMLGTVAAALIALLAANRAWACVVFGALAFACIFAFGTRPFAFYDEWLFTHPRLRPQTRARRPTTGPHPDWVLLLAVLSAAWILPIVSTSLALVVLLALAVVLGRPGVPFKLYRDIFGQYVTYGSLSSGAPGVWLPRDSVRTRALTMIALTLPFYLALTTGLERFMPTDLMTKLATRTVAASPHPDWNEVARNAAERLSPTRLFFYFLPVSLAYAFLVPNLLLLAIFRPAFIAAAEAKRRADTLDIEERPEDERTEWQWYVDRLRTSPHVAEGPLGDTVREADHLFLGVEPNFKFPVLLDRTILSEHAYIVGETGSGKTSLGLMPLLLQLLRGQAPRHGKATPRPAIVILDLKGDPALFHTMREECESLNVPFRFFTPEPHRATHHFNPFRDLRSDSRSIIQLCQLLLDSLSLSHGEGYGRSYYSRQSRHALLSVLRKSPNIQSFAELYDALERLKRDKKDAFELISTIHALTYYPQLLTTPGGGRSADDAIHMPRVLEDCEVVYFWLPAALESASVREIGKLALYSLLTAAIDRTLAQRSPRQAFLVIDEFQRVAGENFKIILEQARSFGIGAVLANQTQSDLQTPDADLRPTVRTNTRLKLAFTVTDPMEIRTLVETSGEEIATMRSWSETFGGETMTSSHSWTESLKPRLTRNDVLQASDHPLHFIAQVSRGSGYTQFGGLPLQVRTTWPIARSTYKKRSAASWPTVAPGTLTSERAVTDIEQERTSEALDTLAAQRAQLEALLDRKAPKRQKPPAKE